MKKYILLLCILGNPYDLIHGGHQRTIMEIIQHFKYHSDLNFSIITSKISDTQGYSCKHLFDNITYYEIGILQDWVDVQDLLYEHRDYLLEQIYSIIEDMHDINLIHSTYWISGLLGSIIAKKFNCMQIHYPISTSFEKINHGFPPRSKYQRYAEDVCFTFASLILVITKEEADILHKEYNINLKKIYIIGRIVEPCFQNIRFEISEDITLSKIFTLYKDSTALESYEWWNKSAFCYIGRMADYTGIKEILSAWEILYNKHHEKTPPLWLLGGNVDDISTYRKAVLSYVPSLMKYENEHKIYWWGYSTSEGLATILSKCSVMIMHSAFEPGGRVMLEAFATGTPVISTPCGFSRDSIINWLNGFIVPYKDIIHLAHFMNFFLKNEYLSNMLGIQAQHTFYSLEKTWNYFQTLDSIYHGTFYNKLRLHYPESEDIHKNLFINAFPYCDIENDTDTIRMEFHLTSDFEKYVTTDSYLWKSEHFFIKQYFNRLNVQQLWNESDTKKIICLKDLYLCSIYSNHFKNILPIREYSDKLFTYTMPCGERVNIKQCFENMKEILSLLYKEGEISLKKLTPIYEGIDFRQINASFQKNHKPYTFSNMLSELNYILDKNCALFENKTFLMLKHLLQLLKAHKYDTYYSINYGKSVINHIVRYNGKLYLLPSGDMFYGEIGFDYAYTYLEYYDLTDLFALLNDQTQNIKVIYWICCILLQKYIRDHILFIEDSINITELSKIIQMHFTKLF